MKILSCFVLATILLTATAASAYHLAPPHTKAKLRGTLTFTPNQGGNTHPFKCKVVLELKTKSKSIIAVRLNHGDCEGVEFTDLPWRVFNLSRDSGEFGFVVYGSNAGNCQQAAVQFQLNDEGIWTLPSGQCLSGTLTSHPPVTIVP